MKIIKKVSIFLLIMSLCLSTVCIAVDSNATNIISMSSDKIEPNKDFYLNINISAVNYNKFKVEITNSLNLSANELTETVSALSKNEVITSFIIDKAVLNLSRVGIIYTAPEVLGKVNFSVKITNLDVTTDTIKEDLKQVDSDIEILNETLAILSEELKNLDINSEEYTEVNLKIDELKLSIEEKELEKEKIEEKLSNFKEEVINETIYTEVVDVVNNEVIKQENQNQQTDKKENTELPQEQENQNTEKKQMSESNETQPKEELTKDKNMMDRSKMKIEDNEEMSEDMKNMMSKMTNLESSLKNANNTISSLTQNTQYKGSQNNYLKTLSIKGIDLGSEFKKTTSNYFTTIDKSIDSVTINATAEDSNAIVTVYGNTDLKEGKNKVLINVTSEDGSVRTYKIYITK